MTAARRPWGSVLAAVRDTMATAADPIQARAMLIQQHGKAGVDTAIGRLRRREEVPAFVAKHDVVNVSLTPALRKRLRALAADRDLTPRRVAFRAMLIGLEAMERRP